MTDRTTITLDADLDLMVAPHDAGIRLSLLPVREAPAHISITVATSALLAAIDAADPDAMRAYLRERSDLIDAPDDSCSTLEDMLPADLAAEAARYRIDAVPEVDSPEDVDEHLAPVIERRLHVIERLAKILRAGTDAVEVCTLADWVIDR